MFWILFKDESMLKMTLPLKLMIPMSVQSECMPNNKPNKTKIGYAKDSFPVSLGIAIRAREIV